MKRILLGIAIIIGVILTLLILLLLQKQKTEPRIFSVASEVAPVLDFWTTYTNSNFSYEINYPSSWSLNNHPGKFDPKKLDSPAEISIGRMTINAYKLEPETVFNCTEISCEYFYYGYGEQIESGTAIMLNEPAVWEKRTSSGHTYYNLVFSKFGYVYSISFLHPAGGELTFDQAWPVYEAVLASFKFQL